MEYAFKFIGYAFVCFIIYAIATLIQGILTRKNPNTISDADLTPQELFDLEQSNQEYERIKREKKQRHENDL